MPMHRLFVAIRPPQPVRTFLLDQMHGIEGARWQNDNQLHLTLRFIGEVDRHQAQDIAAALGSVSGPALSLMLDGVGTFDRRGRIDMLWAGVAPQDALRSLHKKVDRACESIGIAPDQRAYLPHITIARLNRSAGPVEGYLAAHAGLATPPFTIDHFTLFESEMGREGSVYHMVERYPLNAR